MHSSEPPVAGTAGSCRERTDVGHPPSHALCPHSGSGCGFGMGWPVDILQVVRSIFSLEGWRMAEK